MVPSGYTRKPFEFCFREGTSAASDLLVRVQFLVSGIVRATRITACALWCSGDEDTRLAVRRINAAEAPVELLRLVGAPSAHLATRKEHAR
jgi:hypothetical protein